jgi:DNA-binding NtrC family response regulator
VEDEVFIRLDVSEALRAAGFEVIEAKSADDAVSLIEAGEPVDVVFTDIQLPGSLDGLALANNMRAARPSLIVVFTSGDVTKRAEANRIGTFVPKPYQTKAVVDLIADIAETA